jgi:hypothetical protein
MGEARARRTHLQDALHRVLDTIESALGFVGPRLGLLGALLRGLEVRGQRVDTLLVVFVDLIQPALELLHLAFGDAAARFGCLEHTLREPHLLLQVGGGRFRARHHLGGVLLGCPDQLRCPLDQVEPGCGWILFGCLA